MGKHKKKHREDADEKTNGKGTCSKIDSTVQPELHMNVSIQETHSEEDVFNDKIKKKKKKKNENRDLIKNCGDDSITAVTKATSEQEQKESTALLSSGNDQTPEKKLKKKRKKKGKANHSDVVEESTNDAVNIDSSKHKRKRSELSSGVGEADSLTKIRDKEDMEQEVDVPRKKHKKKKSSKKSEIEENTVVEEIVTVEKSTKKKKKKKKKDKDCDGNQIKQPENKLLKENHDKAENVIEVNPTRGQWEMNAFEDNAKQNKFLRLLGGFKKGADQTSIQQKLFTPNKTTNNHMKFGVSSPKLCGSVAMNKSEQETYKRTMETEYHSAMSMHLNRGVGLGFQSLQPAKTFSIDTQKSKSVKFDD